ncbi:alpha/beta hydrolase [Microlunatus capsulatus]|uniref:Pimeloyl-ACP methyl ester carboxylesterase n=1 Tax=Microlunatus capsulatus TaxID=99117 RepID=A0ABS4ZA45_9ACTN|nr:alpha/beta hydrolase [Microlunatus capsulatus]MBP2417620.1 pimeloyl-ACP methyl ester carboxylesterase [Microlunatus capsulatus]
MPARRRRSLASGLAVLLLLAGCALPGGDRAPAPSPEPATVTPTVPALPAQGRPLTPVPDVAPTGFADPPPGQGTERYRAQTLTWRPCGRGLQCTTVLAPLDADDPDGRALTLALAKRPATAEPRRGTLFVNPGGPGGSGRNYVGYFDAEGLESYDVVGWDPRGVGASTPVRCYGAGDLERYLAVDLSPDDEAEEQALVAENYAFGQACLQHSGALLEHISTQDTVRDLELLRQLVGDPQLHYFGASYGTRIGALYAELYPATVGRLVLDGAVDISDDEADVSQLEGFERALRHFARWAATSEAGQPLGTSQAAVLSRVRRLLTGLDAQPLTTPAGRVLSQQQGVQGLLTPLYGREQWPDLLRALTSAAGGDGRGLLALADQGNQRRTDGTYGQINDAFPAVRCLDSRETSVVRAEEEAAEAAVRVPVLGPISGPDLVCPLWPVAPAPEPPRITGEGAAPVVVLGTTGDPATPYENAVTMAGQLRSGVLVTLEGEGHTAYDQSACVRGLVLPYLLGGPPPADGTRCAA